ncbi:uncharacterized protein LOC132722654 [Ruditapes philippinarum]|uniref:uncharacterized protein LOC132722654 n=1 Tax=Ruditapes philippinarum TaxID=129788 RepID=UPI00295AD9A8|nr:uncharacterized protein LOC132722654 [Ruditapes philippinarum]
MSSAGTRCSSMFGIIIFILFFVGSYADISFVLSRNEGTWQQASTSCKSIRGSLAILDNVQLQQAFDRDIQPAPGESVWVGRYIGYSQTVTIDGCYRNMSLVVKRSKILVNNYLVTCLRECQDTAYIGLQGQFCYCVDNIPQQAVSVPGVYCRRPCPGETLDNSGSQMSWCGSQEPQFNTVSMYRRLKPGEIQLDMNAPNQGECIAYNAKADKWLPLDCNQPKLFTCDRLQCTAPPNMCVLESNALNTWYQARIQCEGTTSRLATVNRTTNNYFKQKVMFNDPVYWTAFHRKQVIVWSYDSSPKDIEQSDRCFAAIKQNGKWQLVVDWCKKAHKYACVQEKQSTPSPTTPMSTISPQQTTPRVTRPATQPTSAGSTSETLPTVDPFATPLSVTASAGNNFMRLTNLMSIVVVQFVAFYLNIRYFNIF